MSTKPGQLQPKPKPGARCLRRRASRGGVVRQPRNHHRPTLSNPYLNEVDPMLERAREVTRNGKYTCIEYVRFADHPVILIDVYKRHDWLMGAVSKRLREEFGKLQVEINDEKGGMVDLEPGEALVF
jgi:RNA-directed DNA polymerase